MRVTIPISQTYSVKSWIGALLLSYLKKGTSRIIIYLDECHPGNILRPDHGRKLMCIYWTWLELPEWWRTQANSWFDGREGYGYHQGGVSGMRSADKVTIESTTLINTRPHGINLILRMVLPFCLSNGLPLVCCAPLQCIQHWCAWSIVF